MPIGNSALGKEIHVVGHAPFNPWAVGIGLFFSIALIIIIVCENNISLSEAAFGLLFSVFLLSAITFYCFRSREGNTLVVFETGLWYPAPDDEPDFVPWEDIKAVLVKGTGHAVTYAFNLVIVPHDIQKYWGPLPLWKKVLRIVERCLWGTHIVIGIPNSANIEPESFLEMIRSRVGASRRGKDGQV